MTPSTDTTATLAASAIRPRRQPDDGSANGRTIDGRTIDSTPILNWPTAVWLVGSAPWVAAWFCGFFGNAPHAFLIVGAICFTATVASLLPIRNLAGGPADALPVGLLATIAVRGGTTLVLLIAAIVVGVLERTSVALPIVLWYMAFLVTDLIVVNRFLSNALPLSGRPPAERTTC